MKRPFTDKERELLHKSRVAKVLAQAAFDHSLTFYQTRRTIDDDEMFSLICYHHAGIVLNAIQDKSKAWDVSLAWNQYDILCSVSMNMKSYSDYLDSSDDVCYSEYFADVCKAYEEHEEEQTIERNHSNAKTAEEIAAFERILADERDINPWYTANDNDIAFETYEEIRRVGKIRQLAVSAYNKGINTLTVIRFMNEKLANDAERGIFLEQYASAGFWDGYDTMLND